MPHIENVNGEYSVTKSQQKLVYVKKKSTTYGQMKQPTESYWRSFNKAKEEDKAKIKT